MAGIGKKLKLVRYDNRKHCDALFRYMMDQDEQIMFLTHTVSNSIRDFDCWIQDQLKYFYQEFFVLESEQEELVGIMYSYDDHIKDGHCKIGVYIVPKWRWIGTGAMAGLQLMNYLFQYYPYRQIYCDVYSYNNESFHSLLQCGFEQTGYYREYRYYNGEYYDLLLLTMSRIRFQEQYASLFIQNESEKII